MNIFHNEHIAILKLLIQQQVEFLLIGGVAVNYYGYPRPTGDLDVWLKPNDANRDKLIRSIRNIGRGYRNNSTRQLFRSVGFSYWY